MINISKPFLPPAEEYKAYIDQIWNRNWLTNNGPLVNELELKLKELLNINHVLYVANGTIALQMAIRALRLTGEIITTPFSYIATTSSILWENCTPIFADIDPATLNIDPREIESKITPATTAIIATHTYGNACDIESIEAIAARHGIKVIYDAAHCFGTTYKGKSIYHYGTISTASFHATKIFHTIEGGAVFTQDPELLKKMAFMRNFGHNGPEHFADIGINGKNSEFHAAMGLVNLRYISKIAENRRLQYDRYNYWLQYLHARFIELTPGSIFNYAYYPLIFESENAVLKSIELLNANGIYPRRYFYPSLNSIGYVPKQATPVCDDISPRVLCLPMYFNLSIEEIDLICRLLLRVQNN